MKKNEDMNKEKNINKEKGKDKDKEKVTKANKKENNKTEITKNKKQKDTKENVTEQETKKTTNKKSIETKQEPATKSEKKPKDKIISILVIASLSFIGIELLILLLGIMNKKIAYITWLYFVNPIKSIRYSITQYFSVKIGLQEISIFYIILIGMLIILGIYYIATRNCKMSKEKKDKLTDFVKITESLVIFIEVGLYLAVELLSFNNPNIDSIYFKKQVNNKYTKDDVYEFLYKLEDKVTDLADLMERDKEGNIIIKKEIETLAITDMKSASKRYKILSGPYPKRYLKITTKELKKQSTINGRTGIDAININYNQPYPQLLSTITHELCHTRGVARENEAVLCSVMTGVESNNFLSNYAAYLEAYSRTLDAMQKIDSLEAISSEDRMSSLCMEKGYKEICKFYNIETEFYVEESKEIEIGTYNTSYYDKEDLKEMIEALIPYKPKFYLDDEQIPTNEIIDKIQDDRHLIITIENDEENFERIQAVLNKYEDKLQYVSQLSPNDYTVPELTEEEAEEYYTQEAPESNVVTQLEDEAEKEFDYSRAVRLLMEYFDNENL